MVSSLDRLNKTPVYSIHSYLDSFILYNEHEISAQVKGSEKDLGPPEHSYSPSNEENDNQKTISPEQQLNDKNEIETL